MHTLTNDNTAGFLDTEGQDSGAPDSVMGLRG